MIGSNMESVYGLHGLFSVVFKAPEKERRPYALFSAGVTVSVAVGLSNRVLWLFVGLSFLTIYYRTASCQHVHCF